MCMQKRGSIYKEEERKDLPKLDLDRIKLGNKISTEEALEGIETFNWGEEEKEQCEEE